MQGTPDLFFSCVLLFLRISRPFCAIHRSGRRARLLLALLSTGNLFGDFVVVDEVYGSIEVPNQCTLPVDIAAFYLEWSWVVVYLDAIAD